jgi:hypothetical protein
MFPQHKGRISSEALRSRTWKADLSLLSGGQARGQLYAICICAIFVLPALVPEIQMTPEEINRTIEFLIQHAATFSAGMDALKLRQEEFARRQEESASRQEDFFLRHERDHALLREALMDLSKSTARFESWAAEVVAIESRRLDEHDRLHHDARAFQKEAITLLHRILDRLPPPQQ